MDYSEQGIRLWSEYDVTIWLQQIGLPECRQEFSSLRINGVRLLQLTEADIKFKSLKSSKRKKLKEALASLPGGTISSKRKPSKVKSNSNLPMMKPPIQNEAPPLPPGAPPLPPRPNQPLDYEQPPDDIYEEYDDQRHPDEIAEDEDSFDDDYEEQQSENVTPGKEKFYDIQAKFKVFGIGGANQHGQQLEEDDYGGTGEDIYDIPPEEAQPPPPPLPPPIGSEEEFDEPSDIYDLPPEEPVLPPRMKPPIGTYPQHNTSQQHYPEPYIEATGQSIEEDIYEMEDSEEPPPPPPPPPPEDMGYGEDIYDVADDDPFQPPAPARPPKPLPGRDENLVHLPTKPPLPAKAEIESDNDISKQQMPSYLRDRFNKARKKVQGGSTNQPDPPTLPGLRPPPEIPDEPPPSNLPPRIPPKEEMEPPNLPPKPGSPPSAPKLPPRVDPSPTNLPPKLPPKEFPATSQPSLPPKPTSPMPPPKFQHSPVPSHKPFVKPPVAEMKKEEPPPLRPVKPTPSFKSERPTSPERTISPDPPSLENRSSPDEEEGGGMFRRRTSSTKISDLMSKFEKGGPASKPAPKPKPVASRKWPPVGTKPEDNKPKPPAKEIPEKPKLPVKDFQNKPKPPVKDLPEKPKVFKPGLPPKHQPSPPPSPVQKRAAKSPPNDSSGSLDSVSVSAMVSRLRPVLAGDSSSTRHSGGQPTSPTEKPAFSLPPKPPMKTPLKVDPPQPPSLPTKPKPNGDSRPPPMESRPPPVEPPPPPKESRPPLMEPPPPPKESRPPPTESRPPPIPPMENRLPTLPPKPADLDVAPSFPPSSGSPSLPPKNPLMIHPWYHGLLSRKEVSERLNRICKDGCFLLRDAQNGEGFSLSLWYGGQIRHLRVRIREDGLYVVGEKKENELAFPNIPDLIEYHKQEPLVLKSGGQTVLAFVCPKP